jgi:hypothetical protein
MTETRSLSLILYQYQLRMGQRPYYKAWNFETTTGSSGKHRYREDFLNRTPTAQHLRERMNKWDCIKLKTFCTAKEVVTTLKNGRKSLPAIHLIKY